MMKRLFKRDEHKEKATKSNRGLAFWKRKKGEAGSGSDDKQDRCHDGTLESTTLIDSALLQPVNSSSTPPQVQESSMAPPNPDDEYKNTPISELWNLAYENLRKEDSTIVEEYEKRLEKSVTVTLGSAPDTKEDRREWMNSVLKYKMKQIQKEAWKFMFLGSEVRPAEMVESVLKVIKLVNDSITEVVIPSPYASFAWAGISVLISVCLNPQHQKESLAEGLREISSLILQGGMREDLYRRRYEIEDRANHQFSKTHATYKAALEKLYRNILKFQVNCYCYYDRDKVSRVAKDLRRKDDWNGLLKEILRQKAQMEAIDKLWRDQQYDEECAAAENRYQGTILSLTSIGADISELRNEIKKTNEDEKQQKFLNWLCEIDPSILYNAACDKHKDGTSEWLIKEDKKFKSWKQNHRSLLWLHGKAGSGKSVLSSSVIRHLKEERMNDASVAIIYFYFSFSDIKTQERDGMLASLLKQIYCQRPSMPESFTLGETQKEGNRPSTEELENSLVTATYGFSAVYVVIDALDECPDLNGQREQLMKTLHHILAADSNNLHLFCTSRKEPDIDASLRRYLSEPGRVEISLSTYLKKIERDIGLYIDSTLAGPSYSSWPDHIKTEAKEILINKSDGMFQYVRCQFEALRKLRIASDIRKTLTNLPKGLDETYNRMLQTVDDRYRRPVANSLKWLAFSMSPLNVQNLAEIFIMHPDNDDGAVININDRFFEAQEVVIYFSGLIVENRGIVRLAHFSIKEYLTSSRVRPDLAPIFSFTDIDAHVFIADSCLAYNNYLSTLFNDDAEKTNSLKVYAASNWITHLEMAPFEFWHEGVSRKVARLFTIRSKSLTDIIFRYLKRGDQRLYREIEYAAIESWLLRPYCFTAYYGFVHLTSCLLSQAFNAGKYSTQGDLNTALWNAVYNGEEKVAALLLDRGADANASKATVIDIGCGRQHGDVLQMAVSNGNIKMVNLLLDKGADIHAQRWGSALQSAAKGGHFDTLKLLMRRGAKISGPYKETECVLSAAIEDDELFRYLLNNRASINARGTGEEEYTALCAAARSRRWEQFDLLLEKGAKVNIGGEGGYPLHEVVAAGELRRTKQLLSRGGDPNMKGGYYGTALSAACSSYHNDQHSPSYIQIAQLLIDNGADVDASIHTSPLEGLGEWEFRSVLQRCAYLGCTEMAQLLLQNGANINLQGGTFGSALQAACNDGKLEMMRLLLDRGADVNAQGGYYGSALHAVCKSPDFPDIYSRIHALRLLLQRGADVNAFSIEYGSALQAVCGYNEHVAARLAPPLLKRANINAQGGKYGTALQAACLRSPGVVKLLLDKDADVNIQGGEYGTALQAACLGSPGMVKLLLDRGAKVNAVGGKYGSALQAACYSRSNRDLIQLLLDSGADVNAEGGQYGTALQIKCADEGGRFCMREPEIVRMLLEHGADPLLRRGRYSSPLHYAAICDKFFKSDELLRLLLEHGADINQVDDSFGTVLHYVLSPQSSSRYRDWQNSLETWWIDRIHLLLEYGADASLRGGEHGFPLHAACAITYDYEYERTCEFDEFVNNYGAHRGLRLSPESRFEKSFRKLREKTVRQDSIMTLATKGVKMLLDECHTIDINAHGGIFGTALQAAAYSGQTKTVQLLLRRKDRVICNEHCGKYGSALNAAVVRGHWDIVELLLKAGEKTDCHVLQEPDEEFLTQIREEHGWAAEERYKKFWEVEKRNL